LQISCKLSLAHPVTQSWKHLAPDNIEYYRSSSAHVRTWLLGVLQTKQIAHTHTHTHGEKNLQNNTHTINRRNISPNPSIRSTKKQQQKLLEQILGLQIHRLNPDNTHPPLLLLLFFFFFFFLFQILRPMTTKQNRNRPQQKQRRNDKKDTGIKFFQSRL
jgi:hypothetical protein